MASNYGTVGKHGKAAMAASKGARKGPGGKNLGPAAKRKGAPGGEIRGKARGKIKGVDLGTG